MNIQITQIKDNYHLKIDYPVSLSPSKAWEWVATSEGFARWFGELHIEDHQGEKILVFEMDDFREEMKVLEYEKDRTIAYEWSGAEVHFTVAEEEGKARIYFEEKIPVDFESPYSSAKKDMAGWATQNEVLSSLMNGEEVFDIEVLQKKWQDYMEKI
ncbi:MAG: SRPBCC domain-containing protein [Gallicola sp.]|nr:SRPBCC domain-containing protein [Gallicola sp.]